MANYLQEHAQDAVCQSHIGHMTGLWFLLTRPLRLNSNKWMKLYTKQTVVPISLRNTWHMCEEPFKCSYMLCPHLYGKIHTKMKCDQICPSLRLIVFPKLPKKYFDEIWYRIRITVFVGLKFWFMSLRDKLSFKKKIKCSIWMKNVCLQIF
jgi:hypothetical protein